MKKADIAMIVLIAGTSVLISFFVAKMVFGDVYKGTAKVKTVERIESEVSKPSEDIFNENAINPAVKITIDDPANSGSPAQ